MKKERRKTIVLTSIITLLPLFAGVILWNRLPEVIATHFGADGTPNGWSSKEFAVFCIPLFILAAHLLCVFITANDPKRQNIGSRIFGLICWICPACSLFAGAAIYANALGIAFHVEMAAQLLLGGIFLVTGNYLPKSRQNFTVGFKLPWTLADEENWNRTHRLAGYLWVIGGLVLIVNAFLNIAWLIAVVIAVLVFLPMIYSLVFYLRRQH